MVPRLRGKEGRRALSSLHHCSLHLFTVLPNVAHPISFSRTTLSFFPLQNINSTCPIRERIGPPSSRPVPLVVAERGVTVERLAQHDRSAPGHSHDCSLMMCIGRCAQPFLRIFYPLSLCWAVSAISAFFVFLFFFRCPQWRKWLVLLTRFLIIEDVVEYVLWFLPAPPSCFVFNPNNFYWNTCPWCWVDTDATEPLNRIEDDNGLYFLPSASSFLSRDPFWPEE